jgi:hypothetical protein
MGRRKKRERPGKDSDHKGESPAVTRRGSLRKRLAIFAAAAAVIISITTVSALVLHSPAGPPKAAIVDQLSLTQPNPTFVETATNTLEQAGYIVDYYPGEQVTVEFYRNLPSQGYDVVLLRGHSGITRERVISPDNEEVTETDYVSLFTAEPYSETRYSDEQRTGRLGVAEYYEGSDQYFGIAPGFIESSMKGGFDDTTIIMMGCDGLRSTRTAEAFLERGAESFISWSKPVSAAHTDAATERLLEHLLLEDLPTQEAVSQTMAEVGPDPTYEAELRFYP